jgi:hypothetical protein
MPRPPFGPVDRERNHAAEMLRSLWIDLVEVILKICYMLMSDILKGHRNCETEDHCETCDQNKKEYQIRSLCRATTSLVSDIDKLRSSLLIEWNSLDVPWGKMWRVGLNRTRFFQLIHQTPPSFFILQRWLTACWKEERINEGHKERYARDSEIFTMQIRLEVEGTYFWAFIGL